MSAASALQAARTTATKAARKELERDLDGAFELYISSARAFLQLANAYPELNATARAEANKSLDRAEKIKRAKPSVQPMARDAFAADEQRHALQLASHVFGAKLALWTTDAERESSVVSDPHRQPSVDADISVEWRRSSELMPNASMTNPSLRPIDIEQTVTGNCSVVASLAVCLEHQRQFGSKLVLSSLFPRDQTGMPVLSSSGQHTYKLHINGAPRCVSIDDRLPVNPDSAALIGASTGQHQTLWPLLVEKAYMQAMGGYTFDGSNSGIDLHALIGWIPEQVLLNGVGVCRDALFGRLQSALARGRCLATLGTGKDAASSGLHWLIASHDYAVLGITEERVVRLMDPLASSDGSVTRERQLDWDIVCAHFDSVYISWDPQIFQHSQTLHGIWPKTSQPDSTVNRQIRVTIDDDANVDAELWVLLTRHFPSTHDVPPPFVAVHAMEATSASTSSHNAERLSGSYTDGPHSLLRVPITRGQRPGPLSIIASRQAAGSQSEDSGTDWTFTLGLFCARPFTIASAPPKALHSKKIDGSFNARNAGGNPAHPSFMVNPQWMLRFTPKPSDGKKAQLKVTVEGAKDLSLNAKLVWGTGKRVTDVVEGDVVLDSGPYRYGIASIEETINLNEYTLAVSSFNPKETGPFLLTVESSVAFSLDAIPQEGSGMYSTPLRGSWSRDTAGGAPSSGQYHANPKYVFSVTATTTILARLQLASRTTNIALNLTVFAWDPQTRTLARQVATSGAYTETVSGALVPETRLGQGHYVLVPSTYAAGLCMDFRVMLHADVAGLKLDLQ